MDNLTENFRIAAQTGLELEKERDKLFDELQSIKKDYTKQMEVLYSKYKFISTRKFQKSFTSWTHTKKIT